MTWENESEQQEQVDLGRRILGTSHVSKAWTRTTYALNHRKTYESKAKELRPKKTNFELNRDETDKAVLSGHRHVLCGTGIPPSAEIEHRAALVDTLFHYEESQQVHLDEELIQERAQLTQDNSPESQTDEAISPRIEKSTRDLVLRRLGESNWLPSRLKDQQLDNESSLERCDASLEATGGNRTDNTKVLLALEAKGPRNRREAALRAEEAGSAKPTLSLLKDTLEDIETQSKPEPSPGSAGNSGQERTPCWTEYRTTQSGADSKALKNESAEGTSWIPTRVDSERGKADSKTGRGIQARDEHPQQPIQQLLTQNDWAQDKLESNNKPREELKTEARCPRSDCAEGIEISPQKEWEGTQQFKKSVRLGELVGVWIDYPRPSNPNSSSRAEGSRAITWRDIPALQGDTSHPTDDWDIPRSPTPADLRPGEENPPPGYHDVPAPPGTASPSTWGWRVPLSFPIHELLDPLYDDLASAGEPWSPPSPIPVHAPSPDRLLVTPNAILPPPVAVSPPALNVEPVYRYYAHPADQAPMHDVETMEAVGREARTGDHVYRVDARQLGVVLSPIPEEEGDDMDVTSDAETSSSDSSFEHIGAMEGVQDDAPAITTLARVAALIDERDESIQEPTFVFGAFTASPPEPRVPTPPAPIVQDFEDAELQSTSSEEEGEIREAPPVSRAAAVAIPVLGNGKRGALVTRDRYSSSPSMYASTCGFETSEGEEGGSSALSPLHSDRGITDDEDLEMTELRRKAQALADEVVLKVVAARVVPSPRNSQVLNEPGEEEDSDDGSIPPLTDVSSESDARSYVCHSPQIDPASDEYGYVSNAATYPTPQLARSLGRHLHEIRHYAPSPVVEDNVLAREYGLVHLWSANYDREQEELRTRDNNYAAEPLLELIELFENGPLKHTLDRALMERDDAPIEPTWNSAKRHKALPTPRLANRVSDSSENQPTSADIPQAQVTAEMLDAVSIPTHDGQRRLRQGFKFPLQASTREVRRFNGRALALGVLFRAALGAEAGKCAEEVVALGLALQLFQTHLDRGEDLLKRLGWSIDLTCLHDEDPDAVDLPFAFPHQNSKFQILNHAFFVHGRTAISDPGRKIMKLRFKEPEFIAHLLCSGLLDPLPVATSPDSLTAANESNENMPRFRPTRASFDFRSQFPPANSATQQNEKPAGGSRLTQSWAEAAVHDQAVRISARAVEARNALEARLDAVDAACKQPLRDCLQHGLTPCRPTYRHPVSKELATADKKGKRKQSPRREAPRPYSPSPLAHVAYSSYVSSSSG
ncbi:hypothetical protein DFH06DRAFT_1137217 [Mycena polygramma]|nr:hypothetical protein DFH06DRAFT_1137217 [Mycena polygramma]